MTTIEVGPPHAGTGTDLLDILASGDPPAFAVDENHRIIFWNRGAERMLGRSAGEALGRHCYDILSGRDVFGNRFCYSNCAVVNALRRREAVNGFEIELPSSPTPVKRLNVTIVQVPGARPELFTAVHVLQAVEESSRLARALARLDAPNGSPAPRLSSRGSSQPSPPLTEREKQILGWVAEGLQNKEIAQKLGISLATVRNHVHNVLEKLGVHSKLEAVSLSFRNGWTRDAAGRADRGLESALTTSPRS